MRQIRAADNKLRRLFQDAVITERREALAKAIYSIKDDFVGMIGMSQRPSLGVRTQSNFTTGNSYLNSPVFYLDSVTPELGISIDEARDI
jgi:hypothetical protein